MLQVDWAEIIPKQLAAFPVEQLSESSQLP